MSYYYFPQDPDYYGCGDSNGVYSGKEYFTCEESQGLFLSLAAIKPPLVASQPVTSMAPSPLTSPVSTPPHNIAWSLSLPHSYLLLRANVNNRGALMEEGYSTGNFIDHSHLRGVSDTIICLSEREIASLTEEQCHLLDAIEEDADRYAVYSSPGKLVWGVGLKVGDAVLARLPGEEKYTAAIIRAIGVDDKCGQRYLFGVEITVSLIVSL